MSKIPTPAITELLDAGIHFGHKTSRWNPKMAPYIYGVKDDIHVVDLQQTLGLMKVALKVVYETAKNNGKILFVGTKIQAGSIIAEYAEKCGQFYVNHRWLGGMLTNSGTISQSIKKLDELEKILADEELCLTYTKKELLEISRKCKKLQLSLGGIRKLKGKPDLIFIMDTNKEHLAIKEAKKLGIPLVAVVDTNSNPDAIDYIIPGNDDAIRSIKFYCQMLSDAALAGIKESLVQSGVDIGELSSVSVSDKDTGTKKITKLKTAKKVVTKANVSDEDNKKFEEALEKSVSKEETK